MIRFNNMSQLKCRPLTFTDTWHHLYFISTSKLKAYTAEHYTRKDIGLGGRRPVFGPGAVPNKPLDFGHAT